MQTEQQELGKELLGILSPLCNKIDIKKCSIVKQLIIITHVGPSENQPQVHTASCPPSQCTQSLRAINEEYVITAEMSIEI